MVNILIGDRLDDTMVVNGVAPTTPLIGAVEFANVAVVRALLDLGLDSATPASTRVRAAESILTHSAKAIEIEDIEARVAALEQSAASGKSGR